MKNLLLVIPVFFLLTLISSFIRFEPEPIVEYPVGYRQWSHIKTAIIGEKNPAYAHFGGFHHIYANSKAMEGYSKGIFPEGSILVFDMLEAIEKDSDVSEGKRRLLDVMVKDSQKFSSTGGWGYAEFYGDSKTQRDASDDVIKQCYTCHAVRKNSDFVFSRIRN